MADNEIKAPGKPIEGEAPDKDYLKKLQKKIRIHNKKYPTAPLVTPGGAANVFGYPINNAFFNRAMGHKVDADDLTPSSTGLADNSSAGDSEGAGESAGASDAGAVAGGDVGGDAGASAGGDAGVGGGVGESLKDTFDALNLSEGARIGDYMTEDEYQDFLEREIKISKEHLNDPSASAFIRDYYKAHVEECEKALKKLKLNEKLELNAADSAKDNLVELLNYINPRNWKNVLNILKKYSNNKSDLSVFANLKTDSKVSSENQYKIKSIIDDIDDDALANTILLADLSHISTAIKYLLENNFGRHASRVDEVIDVLEDAVIEAGNISEVAVVYTNNMSDENAQKCIDEILKVAGVDDVDFIEPEETIDEVEGDKVVLSESFGDDDDLFFKAYITNLGKYNEGELVGEYVEFPIDEDDFNKKLEEIGIGSTDEFGQPYEEWFVTDYETNTGISLGEYVSYEDLNEIGELVDELNKQHNGKAFRNAIEAIGDFDVVSVAEAVNDGDIIFYDDINSVSDLGYEIIDEIYGNDIPKDLIESYFDFEALGRDLRIEYYAEDDDMPETAGEYWCGDENATDADIGWAYYDAVGGEISDPENYFDYEAFGRDLTYENFTLTSDGCIEDRR